MSAVTKAVPRLPDGVLGVAYESDGSVRLDLAFKGEHRQTYVTFARARQALIENNVKARYVGGKGRKL